MGKVREIWAKKQADGWTFQRLGEAMGYPEKQAKQAAQQFIGALDCRVSSLRRFAKAVGVSMARLLKE